MEHLISDHEKYQIVQALAKLQEAVHQIAVDKGWWDRPRLFPEVVALMHSELSEALEAYRTDAMSDKLPEVHGQDEELADCIIRILDYCGARGVDIGQVILDKIEYNLSRAYRHGNKKA